MAQHHRCRSSGMPICPYTDVGVTLTSSARQDPILFTGTIASNIAYGNPDATMEQIEAAARQANCEFVWGMPQGFLTESTSNIPLPPLESRLTLFPFSWSRKPQRRPAPAPCYRACPSEEARHSRTGRGDELTGRDV